MDEREVFRPPSLINDPEMYRNWIREYVWAMSPEELDTLQGDIHERRAEDNLLEEFIEERRSYE